MSGEAVEWWEWQASWRRRHTHLDQALAVRRCSDRRPGDFELAFALELALLFGVDRL